MSLEVKSGVKSEDISAEVSTFGGSRVVRMNAFIHRK